jgi:hypothetical protein
VNTSDSNSFEEDDEIVDYEYEDYGDYPSGAISWWEQYEVLTYDSASDFDWEFIEVDQ